MTDLTEKLKKGELSEGHYYIKTHGETNIDEYVQWYKDNEIPSEKSFVNFNVEQVLAPVPSYEEWKAKLEENIKLKELLKEYKLNHDDLMKDAYINYCKVNHRIGENPNPEMIKECTRKLAEFLRWNERGGRDDR